MKWETRNQLGVALGRGQLLGASIKRELTVFTHESIPNLPSCRITSFLGSGAFGSVNKGLWQSPGGTIEVAVKTIQSDKEEEKVKFLQEAAIMGQFRHPNVVKLMGVVTVGEPVG